MTTRLVLDLKQQLLHIKDEVYVYAALVKDFYKLFMPGAQQNLCTVYCYFRKLFIP